MIPRWEELISDKLEMAVKKCRAQGSPLPFIIFLRRSAYHCASEDI